MWFIYSVNDEKFYYKELTCGGDEKLICLTKEQYLEEEFTQDYIVTGETEYWDKKFVKKLCYKGRNKKS